MMTEQEQEALSHKDAWFVGVTVQRDGSFGIFDTGRNLKCIVPADALPEAIVREWHKVVSDYQARRAAERSRRAAAPTRPLIVQHAATTAAALGLRKRVSP